MTFKQGNINGVVIRELNLRVDERGWLVELFRSDETDEEQLPAMAYVSSSAPGVTRGPHEHTVQSDNFCMIGPSTFRVFCWDNRKSSPTFGNKMVFEAGENRPRSIFVPPGVVHAYRNIGSDKGWVINLPNRLYAGRRRKEPLDEIRHEQNPHSEFTMEESTQ